MFTHIRLLTKSHAAWLFVSRILCAGVFNFRCLIGCLTHRAWLHMNEMNAHHQHDTLPTRASAPALRHAHALLRRACRKKNPMLHVVWGSTHHCVGNRFFGVGQPNHWLVYSAQIPSQMRDYHVRDYLRRTTNQTLLKNIIFALLCLLSPGSDLKPAQDCLEAKHQITSGGFWQGRLLDGSVMSGISDNE